MANWRVQQYILANKTPALLIQSLPQYYYSISSNYSPTLFPISANKYIINLSSTIESTSILLSNNKIPPFLIQRQRTIRSNDNAIMREDMFFLCVERVDGQWKAKDPIC